MPSVPVGARLRVSVFTDGVFQQNSWLVSCARRGRGVAIDPGAGAEALFREAEREGITIEAIWLTHAHLDHVEGIPDLLTHLSIPVALHPADRPLYDRAPDQATAFGLSFRGELPAPSIDLQAGDVLRVGELAFDVRFTPGHAPGHVIFVLRPGVEAGGSGADPNGSGAAGSGAGHPEPPLAFVGDVIFQRSIGRTDLPGGDTLTLLRSIREEVLTLPDDTLLLSGHGPPTTVGEERFGNPFLRPMTGGEGEGRSFA